MSQIALAGLMKMRMELYYLNDLDELDQLEFLDFIASEINNLKQHRDILGDGFLEIESDEDFD